MWKKNVIIVDTIESIQNTWWLIHVSDDALLRRDGLNAEVKDRCLIICTIKVLLDT